MACVHEHRDLESCVRELQPRRLLAVETGGSRSYAELRYAPGDALLFGRETTGLPAAVIATLPPEHLVRIPMRPGNRSLNLSNAVALVVYEAWRQQGFAMEENP